MKDEFIQTNQIPEILSKINGLDKEKSIKKKDKLSNIQK